MAPLAFLLSPSETVKVAPSLIAPKSFSAVGASFTPVTVIVNVAVVVPPELSVIS